MIHWRSSRGFQGGFFGAKSCGVSRVVESISPQQVLSRGIVAFREDYACLVITDEAHMEQ